MVGKKLEYLSRDYFSQLPDKSLDQDKLMQLKKIKEQFQKYEKFNSCQKPELKESYDFESLNYSEAI